MSSSNSEVQRLISIADAGVKKWKGHWYTLGIPIPAERYNFDEQLEAIRQLGRRLGDMDALRYLKSITEVSEVRSYPKDNINEDNPWDGDFIRYEHPNARGEFGAALFGDDESEPTKTAKKVLRNALSQLEESLGE